MKTVYENGNKKVRIFKKESGYLCLYIQVYNELGQEQEQVLESKIYKTEAKALKYATVMLRVM